MTEREGRNVWGDPSPAEPTQRWRSRLEPGGVGEVGDVGGQGGVPTPPTDSVARRQRPSRPAGRGRRRVPADLVVWGVLAFGALLLLLCAFALWDRPTDPSATLGTSGVSISEATHAP
jgi:hypothetical protein